ncbi:hypothetical protein D8674_028711 [Pyrus ussuriensis x Pyrus communis]|uniref:Uncharacterized protein n=1 Tax=Pyrus ussuriensis x Pyrus communis TaxID=2448454 RepID=A0A5N5IAI2_9ROSA|nr:hypothetical protein D8674_028711 [Pyrus ussuriensis x Pyrus communis]
MMALVQNETMRNLDIPTILESPSSIALPAATRNYELKNIHFNMMPSFHGIRTEDPLALIRDIFNMEHLRMKVFPYTKKDKAKTWLNSLRLRTLTNKIMHFTQQVDDTFSEAWERSNNLLIQCRHHGLRLTVSSKATVTNYTKGSIKNKTPAECQALFDTLVLETQHSKAKGRHAGVFEINNSIDFASKVQVDAIASKLDTLLSMNGRAPIQENVQKPPLSFQPQEKKNNLEDVIAQLATIMGTTTDTSQESAIVAMLLTKHVVYPMKPYFPLILFPQWLKKNKLNEKYFKFLEMFKKLQINIPFKPNDSMEAALVHATTSEDENQLLAECALYLDAFKSVEKSGRLEFKDLRPAPSKSQPSIIAALPLI